jgi:hypothetical protein
MSTASVHMDDVGRKSRVLYASLCKAKNKKLTKKHMMEYHELRALLREVMPSFSLLIDTLGSPTFYQIKSAVLGITQLSSSHDVPFVRNPELPFRRHTY